MGERTIVTCGGVGLGALWPAHTNFKRTVVRDFPQNPILVLPSTLAFRNRAEQDEVRDLFGDHGNVTVMARDAESHRVIQETFRDV